MEHGDQTIDFLPTDEELLQRENIFLSLFDKYNIDEGSDPELVEDVNTSTVSSESNHSSSSFSEASDCETEESFNKENLDKQLLPLQPFIKDRVNGWSEKGINFELKTVDRGVSVEEWLEANQEFTTTTKKFEKTVINDNNKTTTITTTRTKTTTTRTSFHIRRNTEQVAQMQAITNGESIDGDSPRDGPVIQMGTRTENDYFPNDLISSKKFDLPRGQQKRSTPDHLNPKRNASSLKVKRLSPQKMRLRNRKESVSTKRNSKGSESDSGIYSSEVSKDVSNELTNEVFSDVSKDIRNEVSNEFIEDGAAGYVHENVSEGNTLDQTESDRSQAKEVSHPKINTTLPKPRPQKIVVYSPGAGKKFGKRIDDKFISVTKTDLKKGIDAKYHQYTDFSIMKKCIVPVKQRLVYVPPTDMATEKSSKNDDSETDDDLLTSYTTTGRFYRMSSK